MTTRPATPPYRLPPIQPCGCTDSRCPRRDTGFYPNCTCSSCIHSEPDTHQSDDDDSLSGESIEGKHEQKAHSTNHQPSRKRETLHAATIWDSADAALAATDLKVPPSISRFCLVSLGYSASDCVKISHIVPWTLDEDNLAKLEFAWGLPYCGLNHHSRYNILSLNAELHGSFHQGCWGLLPIDSQHLGRLATVFDSKGSWRKMDQESDRMSKIYRDAKSFRYLFLPLPHKDGMRNPIVRRNVETWPEKQLTGANCKTNFFPYDGIPILSSHIQPHFAIFHLGTKLQKHNLTIESFLGSEYAPLRRNLDFNVEACLFWALELYDRWTSCRPPRNFAPHPDGLAEDSEIEADNDPNTSNPRTPKIRDDEVYPEDSLTVILEVKAKTENRSDSDDDSLDDEEINDETDSCFYARLNGWVSTTTTGLPPPPPSPARSGIVPESATNCYNRDGEVGDIGLGNIDLS